MRCLGIIVLYLSSCFLPTSAKADIDPAEYELKSSLRSERERQRLRNELERDQAKRLEGQQAEADREARRMEAERAAWDALPYPVRLTRNRCTGCHSTGNFEQQRHNRIGWELVVLRMQYLNEAKLESGERAVIAAHLAASFPATGAAAMQEAIEQLAFALVPVGMVLGWRMHRVRQGRG